MLIHVLILNFNGRRLLAECLPSVVDAGRASRHRCDVAVIDNDSSDDSIVWLKEHFPQVRVIRRPNRGLCSFNDVVAELPGPVAILLNNDVKLAPEAIDPLVAPLIRPPAGSSTASTDAPGGDPACFMTAPLCWRFDGRTYEGFKTAVRWHWGLVQATALFAGHEPAIGEPGLTASAGAALAVDCRKFTALGGFNPIFLPGRIEDLDFAFRGYLAGWHARYVPRAVAYHCGMATFGEVFGQSGCDQLALRNTLLFQWKNLRHPVHVARQVFGLSIRLVWDVFRAPWVSPKRRWTFTRALFGALVRLRKVRSTKLHHPEKVICREWAFFRQFHPRRLAKPDVQSNTVHQPSAGRLAVGGTAAQNRGDLLCPSRRDKPEESFVVPCR